MEHNARGDALPHKVPSIKVVTVQMLRHLATNKHVDSRAGSSSQRPSIPTLEHRRCTTKVQASDARTLLMTAFSLRYFTEAGLRSLACTVQPRTANGTANGPIPQNISPEKGIGQCMTTVQAKQRGNSRTDDFVCAEQFCDP